MTQVRRFLTPKGAAARLTETGLPTSEQTMRDWARAGRVPARRTPTGRFLFLPEDIDAILAPPVQPEPANVGEAAAS